MRKIILLFALLLSLAVFSAAAADTEYSLSPCPATVTIPGGNYIVLTRENLSLHPDLLSSIGKTEEEILSDWEERGVVLQAWFQNKKLDACLEISVRQDEDSRMYYDLVNHPADNGWSSFIASHKGASAYSEEGYSVKEAVKKQQKNKNYFLRIKYKRTEGSRVYWGYAAKTVARGYTVVLDYQVYDRGLRSGDQNELNKTVNTLQFFNPDEDTTVAGSAFLQVASGPPVETNTGSFTIQGRTNPGARLIGVLMRINSPDPIRFYADASEKTGDFKMPVTLPEENVWLMTLNVEMNDKIVCEQVFETTTYRHSLLPITFTSPVPETLTEDETVISGVTDKGVTVQCIVTNGTSTFDKMIKTNGSGKFTFKVPTVLEASYHFTVVFSKKGYDTKRFTYDISRNLSEEDRRTAIRKEAIKPAYSTLSRNLDKYVGRIMGYNLFVVDIQQRGEEWIITAAGVRNAAGYRNFMYFLTDEEPQLTIDTQQLFYGTCIGPYVIQSDEGAEQFPAFDLLYIAD